MAGGVATSCSFPFNSFLTGTAQIMDVVSDVNSIIICLFSTLQGLHIGKKATNTLVRHHTQ